jgi:hypothetical protein
MVLYACKAAPRIIGGMMGYTAHWHQLKGFIRSCEATLTGSHGDKSAVLVNKAG